MMTEQLHKSRLAAIGAILKLMMSEARETLREITTDELDGFAQFAEDTETVLPLVDPTTFTKMPYDAFEKLRRRIEIAKLVLEDMQGGTK